VRRPKISQESSRLGLDRSELGGFLVQAGLAGGNDNMLACLLALNARRVSEACGADLTDLALANGHRVVRIVGKGNQLAPHPASRRGPRERSTPPSVNASTGRYWHALMAAVSTGTPPAGSCGGSRGAPGSTSASRRTRHDTPRSPPRSMPDAACETCRTFARHADPRQTRRYDRARGALDRNPTYIVATYLAGATGVR
jgi:integrase/recombinase XerD